LKIESRKYIACFIAALCLVIAQNNIYAQQKENEEDTTEKKDKNIFQFALKAITRSPADSAKEATVLNTKSEDPFLRYTDKIIRHIYIKEYGFERNFSDTSQEIHYFGTNILNKLHRNTREWVIRDNLFIKENEPLNAYVVADNERYLRSLDFIQDVRILVKPIRNVPDSVDLLIITKDLFSLTGQLYDLSPDLFKGKVGDVNVAGMGQEFFFTSLFDKTRSPRFGYEFFYNKNSIANTFINASAGYTTINPDLSYGFLDEKAWYVQLNRPLVSPFTHVAGALLVGHNESHNNFKLPDSLFYNYHYNTFDGWIGDNLGVQKLKENTRIKTRQFVSIRYFRNHFTQTPSQTEGHYNFRFNDRQGILGGITFFKQKFYKTNYIFGFGTTEDVPYGYNIALTTGWYKQADLARPYFGIDANKYVYTNSAYFFQYFLRTGGFLNHGLQDVNFLIGSSLYSKLFFYRDMKIRQYVSLSFAKQFNRIGLDPLYIGNPFGVRYFNTDSAYGDQRISLYSETFLFLKTKIFGFKFSPFAFGNISLLKPEAQSFSKSGAYYGLGGGLRTRNENLVFGTIELRFAYFPRKIDQQSFKITLQGNIRFKFNTSYVKAPDIVEVNNDIDNDIY
jgi:hypothetical protein